MWIGSTEHRDLFCGAFVATHVAYDPRSLPWPQLDERMLRRLRAIPFWGTALQIERNAGFMVTEFARTIADPVIREAIALQGYEEDRHAKMIGALIDRYGLPSEPPGPLPRPTKRAFIDFGYNECLDSFFGFGVFRLAQQAQVFPDALITLFTRVLQEEARHIVFFVNWIAYDRAARGMTTPLLQAPAVAFGYLRSLARLLALIAGGRGKAKAETYGDAFSELSFANLTLRNFVEACIGGNGEMMSTVDARLLKPRVVPTLARLLLAIMPAPHPGVSKRTA